MNKSLWFLLAGIVSGSLITSMLNPLFSSRTNSGYDAQHEEISHAIEELNDTTRKLQNLVQMYTHVLPPVEQINNTPALNNRPYSQSASDTEIDRSYSQQDPASNSMNSQASNSEAVAPTADQIDQYKSIETELYNSANNSSASLSKLIQEAKNLTPEQRSDLTQRALEMIKRGELNPGQFAEKPNS